MKSKVIFKVSFDKHTKNTIKINTYIDNFSMYFKEPFGELMDWAIRMSGYDYESKELKGVYDKLGYLKYLVVNEGFILTLTEMEEVYKLVVHKNTCSTSFETLKENKIETLFVQAEDWAQIFTEDLIV